jgi:hypothetical protein
MSWINNHTRQGMGNCPLLAVFLLTSCPCRVLMGTWKTATRSTCCSAHTVHCPLKVGDRALCLYRDGLAIVTGWSDAPISWPRCRTVGGHGGGAGLLVCEELARAVRHESNVAVQRWWRVSMFTVCAWRRALGVGMWEPEGSKRLHQALSEAGAAAMQGREFTQAERQAKAERAKAMNLIQHPWAGRQEKGQYWTAEQLQLLGTDTDAAIAAQIGRTPEAVRVKRSKLGIPNLADKRWSAEDIALLGTMPDEQVAELVGRTLWAVRLKRSELGIPNPTGNRWRAEDIALLGTLPDEEVAELVGRTVWAVIHKRTDLGIPTFQDRRRAGN